MLFDSGCGRHTCLGACIFCTRGQLARAIICVDDLGLNHSTSVELNVKKVVTGFLDDCAFEPTALVTPPRLNNIAHLPNRGCAGVDARRLFRWERGLIFGFGRWMSVCVGSRPLSFFPK